MDDKRLKDLNEQHEKERSDNKSPQKQEKKSFESNPVEKFLKKTIIGHR